ncbi:hypothetical protein [Carboxylicivirga sp. RSCT41]|uniref:hypothetical protein n=1 Tax=Carboxylicivirga agarovorans TaxID=3417570 RepID=UPI003D335B57
MDEYLIWIFFYNSKIKRFSEDQIAHMEAGVADYSKTFGGNNDTLWHLFDGMCQKIIAQRNEERINW